MNRAFAAVVALAVTDAGCASSCAAKDTLQTKPTSTAMPAVDASAPNANGAAGVIDASVVDAGVTTIRFIAVGDTGRGDTPQMQVARAMETKCKHSGCDFVVMLGDNFYLSGVSSVSDPQWASKFETPYRGINAPFYPVLGNHDYGGGGVGNDFVKGQLQVDYAARSTKWKMPATYYTFTEGPAQFFATDSNMQLYSRDGDQRPQMATWINESRARWKIALSHHPYRSNGPHGNAGTYNGQPNQPVFNGVTVKSFDEEILCGKVDVLMSGHDHSQQWMKDTCNGTELIISGTGSELTSLPGRQPTYYQAATLGFAYIVVDNTSLTLDFVDESGATTFSRTIRKN